MHSHTRDPQVMVRFTMLAAGSRGNATVVSGGRKRILVDCGVSCQVAQAVADNYTSPEHNRTSRKSEALMTTVLSPTRKPVPCSLFFVHFPRFFSP